ncbi:MAG TPA: type I phosphomannose isomerase catalytic subunit, partial [Phycisphaerae bacterium]
MDPLKFQPVFQKRLWGGNRLRTILEKPVPEELAGEGVGESWEVADLPGGTVKADSTGAEADGSLASVVTQGPHRGQSLRELLHNEKTRREIMGPGALLGGENGYFPLLVKFLDAQQDLSVQVHPDAAYCAKHAGAAVKSEAWFVLHAEPGAKIYKGLRRGVTREMFKMALEAGAVDALLNDVPARAGDCHYLPSGTIHALGAGVLAAEVQTPSDTTYRVFDWNRLGADGKGRQLHVEQAMECIRFGEDPNVKTTMTAVADGQRVVANEFFTLDRLSV